MKKLKMGLVMAFMMGMLLAFTGCGGEKAQKVSLNDYVTVTFSGYDGYGKAEANLDFGALETNLGINSDTLENFQSAATLELAVSGDLEQKEKLSNGDKVTYKWNMTEDQAKSLKETLNIKLDFKDFDTEVSGLKDPSEFDITEILNVNVSGYAPDGTLTMSCNVQGFTLEADKMTDLDNGDVVTITVKPATLDKTMEDVCMENDLPVFDGTYTYTVEGLVSYVKDMSEVPETVKAVMDKKAEEALLDFKRDSCECSTSAYPEFEFHKNFDSYELVGTGVCSHIVSGLCENAVVYAYKVNYTVHGDVTGYALVYFEGIKDSDEGVTEDSIYAQVCDFFFVADNRQYFGSESLEEMIETAKDHWYTDADLVIKAN